MTRGDFMNNNNNQINRRSYDSNDNGFGNVYEEDFEDVKSDCFTIKDIVDNIEYSQILGLNNTVITINK